MSATFKTAAIWFIALRPGGYNGVYLRHYDGKSSVDITPSTDQLPLLTDGKWHHLAVTSDRDAEGIIYIDGRLAGRKSIRTVSSASDYGAPVSLQLGATYRSFAGDLDDVTDGLLADERTQQLAAGLEDGSTAGA